jgi:hypothetical protein
VDAVSDTLAPRKPGRPRAFSAEAKAALLGFLCAAMSRADACKMLGISEQTLRNEIKSDEAFKRDVWRAELDGKLKASACVTSAVAVDPKIALQFLERKYPKEWGKRRLTVLELSDGGKVKSGVAVAAELLARLGGVDGAARDETPPAAEVKLAAKPEGG